MRDKLEAIPAVLQAKLQGHREELLEVLIDPAQLEAYGITNEELFQSVSSNNRLIAAGALDTGKGSFSVKVPPDRRAALKGHIGKTVVFGLRPEDIHDPNFAPPAIVAQNVETEVDLTELMGNEIFLFLKSGEDEYVARVDPRTSYKMGDKVTMAFNMNNMHIFDKETEQVVR